MSLLDSLRQYLRKDDRPVRFLIAGAANTAFGIALYPALVWSSTWLQHHYMLALLISQAACICLAYLTYKLALRSDSTSAGQVGMFGSFYLLQYLANLAALPFLVEVIGLTPVVAQGGFIVLLVVSSYFWHSRLTFPQKRAL